MTWVKIDDGFMEHPKIMALGDDLERCLVVHMDGLCFAARNLTDGVIPARRVRGDLDAVKRLVEVGLWDEVDGDYRIHDYLDYNPSRDEALAQKEQRSQAGKKGAAVRWNNGKSHGTRHGKSHDSGYGKTNGKTMPRTRTPSTGRSGDPEEGSPWML